MLAHSAEELQRQLHLDSHCRLSDPSGNQSRPQQTADKPESKTQPQVSPESNIQAQQQLELPDSQLQPGQPPCLSESRTEPQELSDTSQSNVQPLSNHNSHEAEIQQSDQPDSWSSPRLHASDAAQTWCSICDVTQRLYLKVWYESVWCPEHIYCFHSSYWSQNTQMWSSESWGGTTECHPAPQTPLPHLTNRHFTTRFKSGKAYEAQSIWTYECPLSIS